MISQLPRTLVARYAPHSLKQLLRQLRQRLAQRRQRNAPAKHLFVFGGRANYWPGMGRELYEQEPVFRATIQACARYTTELGGPDLLSQFEGDAAPELSNEALILHLLIAVQLALVDLWRAHGVVPEAVLGISVGEVAAVYAAGGFNLANAVQAGFIGAAITNLEAMYGALMVAADYSQTNELVQQCPARLYIAAVPLADRCVVLCAQTDLDAASSFLKSQGVSCHQLTSEPTYPYHTIRLREHTAALKRPLQGLQSKPLARPCYLSSLGRSVPAGTVLGADYWLMMAQHPTLLHATVRAACSDGYQLFTPVGAYPFPFLNPRVQQHLLGRARLLPALTSTAPERATFADVHRTLRQLGLVRNKSLPAHTLTLSEFNARFTLQSVALAANPYPSFAYLQQQGSLHFLPSEGGWLVLDNDLINTVLRAPLVYSSSPNHHIDSQLVGADPPLHTDTRGLFQAFFSPKRLGALAEFARGEIEALGSRLSTRSTFDFVTDFALPLTQEVSGELLGLTPAERQKLHARLPNHLYNFEYFAVLSQFFREYFAQRQAGPEPVLLDHIMDQLQAGRFSEKEAVDLANILWLAGITTTSMLMGSAAYCLLSQPQVAEELRREPALVDAFVEEMLRLESPLHTFLRRTTEPVVLGDQALPAGTLIICCVAAANRDPARFAEPDQVDLHRKPARHLSFGGGIHACMGAHLARLETRQVVQWLLAQPHLQLANASALPEYLPSQNLRVLRCLPLLASPISAANA